VKQFEIVEHYNVPVMKFFEYLIREPNFEEQVHRARGNSKINVTEWMSLGNGHWQRLCFYTMEDPDKNGLGNFVCMETQKYFFNNSEDTIRLDSTISPDNTAVGNVFNIKSEWTVSKTYDDQCDLKIFVQVECKKNIIGFQGMVEGALAAKVRTAYETWCTIAFQKVKEEQEKQSEISILATTKEFYETNRVRLHRRLKSLHHKVVSGTENIVRLFQDQSSTNTPKNDGVEDTLLFDKEKESGEEGQLVSIRDIEEGTVLVSTPVYSFSHSLIVLDQPGLVQRKEKSTEGVNAALILCFFFLLFVLLIIIFN